MSDLLSQILKKAHIRVLRDGKRGGTYVRFSVLESVLDIESVNNLQQKLGVCFYKIIETRLFPTKMWVIEIVHKKNPFEFLRDVVGVKPTEYYYLDFTSPDNRHLKKAICIEWKKKEYCESVDIPYKPNSQSRHWFACILVGFGNDILLRNRKKVADKLGLELTDELVWKFLVGFYEQRIGDAMSLNELPWEKITITEEFLNT